MAHCVQNCVLFTFLALLMALTGDTTVVGKMQNQLTNKHASSSSNILNSKLALPMKGIISKHSIQQVLGSSLDEWFRSKCSVNSSFGIVMLQSGHSRVPSLLRAIFQNQNFKHCKMIEMKFTFSPGPGERYVYLRIYRVFKSESEKYQNINIQERISIFELNFNFTHRYIKKSMKIIPLFKVWNLPFFF